VFRSDRTLLRDLLDKLHEFGESSRSGLESSGNRLFLQPNGEIDELRQSERARGATILVSGLRERGAVCICST